MRILWLLEGVGGYFDLSGSFVVDCDDKFGETVVKLLIPFLHGLGKMFLR